MVKFLMRPAARFVLLALFAANIAVLPAPVQAQGTPPVIFAAASLKTALDAIAADWKKDTGKQVTISYAASSTLAKQAEQGAPADIFMSDDLDWMDWMQTRNLIKPDTRQT